MALIVFVVISNRGMDLVLQLPVGEGRSLLGHWCCDDSVADNRALDHGGKALKHFMMLMLALSH